MNIACLVDYKKAAKRQLYNLCQLNQLPCYGFAVIGRHSIAPCYWCSCSRRSYHFPHSAFRTIFSGSCSSTYRHCTKILSWLSNKSVKTVSLPDAYFRHPNCIIVRFVIFIFSYFFKFQYVLRNLFASCKQVITCQRIKILPFV